MQIARTLAMGLLSLGAAQLPPVDTLHNGSFIADRAVGGKDVAASAYPLQGGVAYSVWNGTPVFVYPDRSRVPADALARITEFPGCSTPGKPFYPAERLCR